MALNTDGKSSSDESGSRANSKTMATLKAVSDYAVKITILAGLVLLLFQIQQLRGDINSQKEDASARRPSIQVQWITAGASFDGEPLDRVKRVLGDTASVAGPSLGVDYFAKNVDYNRYLSSDNCNCTDLLKSIEADPADTLQTRWNYLVLSQSGGSPAVDVRVEGLTKGAGELSYYALDDLSDNISDIVVAETVVSLPALRTGESIIVPVFLSTPRSTPDSVYMTNISKAFLPKEIVYSDTLGNTDIRLDVRGPLATPSWIDSALEVRG